MKTLMTIRLDDDLVNSDGTPSTPESVIGHAVEIYNHEAPRPLRVGSKYTLVYKSLIITAECDLKMNLRNRDALCRLTILEATKREIK